MNNLWGIVQKRFYVLLPFLISIYPGLFLINANLGEAYFSDFLIIAFLSIFFTTTVFFLTNMVFKNRLKSSVFTSLSVFIFFYFGQVAGLLRSVEILGIKIFRWRYLAAFFLLMQIFVFYRLYRSNKKNSLLYFLVFPMLFLNFAHGFNIVMGLYKSKKLVDEYKIFDKKIFEEYLKRDSFGRSDNFPDIYFIILDKYPSYQTLLKHHGYDNSFFLEDLEKKGFILPKDSYSNYQETMLSIPATLNMEYHRDANTDGRILMFLNNYIIKNNRVVRYLKKRGYHYVHVPSVFHSFYESDYSDFHFARPFWEKFLVRTVLGAFLEQTILGPWIRKIICYHFVRTIIRKQLLELKSSTFIKGPKFVFAHFLCPHPPFVFDAEGNSITPKDAEGEFENQITFINNQISRVINHILKNSERPPVIILQADHGMSINDPNDFLSSCNSDKVKSVKKAYGILNAYFFPGEQSRFLYDSITPINNFRIIFKHYLGANLDLKRDMLLWNPKNDGTFSVLNELVGWEKFND